MDDREMRSKCHASLSKMREKKFTNKKVINIKVEKFYV